MFLVLIFVNVSRYKELIQIKANLIQKMKNGHLKDAYCVVIFHWSLKFNHYCREIGVNLKGDGLVLFFLLNCSK